MFCTPAETVKARKSHICTYCGQAIARGELYDTWKTLDDSWFTNKMHSECSKELATESAEFGDYEYHAFSNDRPAKGAAHD